MCCAVFFIWGSSSSFHCTIWRSAASSLPISPQCSSAVLLVCYVIFVYDSCISIIILLTLVNTKVMFIESALRHQVMLYIIFSFSPEVVHFDLSFVWSVGHELLSLAGHKTNHTLYYRSYKNYLLLLWEVFF